eukprot:scaffold1564_cov389-Prasinococcus_capsulatus_cf.AAC.6
MSKGRRCCVVAALATCCAYHGRRVLVRGGCVIAHVVAAIWCGARSPRGPQHAARRARRPRS